MKNRFEHDLRSISPLVYDSFQRGIYTTGAYVTDSVRDTLPQNFIDSIVEFENEDPADIMVVKQVDRWDICVKGRFTPIGKVHALAMLNMDCDQ